jgi:hypothetical protein
MVQIDDLLARLGAAAPDPSLDMIEAAELEGFGVGGVDRRRGRAARAG